METAEKPFIKICSNCQKEFPAVNDAIKKAESRVNFSHGLCERHAREMLKMMGQPESEIEKVVTRIKSKLGKEQPTPDLKEHPELVRQYSQGVFTPDDYKKAQAATPTDNIKEFFQKRAGLIS